MKHLQVCMFVVWVLLVLIAAAADLLEIGTAFLMYVHFKYKPLHSVATSNGIKFYLRMISDLL